MVEMRQSEGVTTVFRGREKVQIDAPNRSIRTLLQALADISVGEEDALSSSDPWAEELFEQIQMLSREK